MGSAFPEFSGMNADDRLSLGPFGGVEGGDGIVESNQVADVCAQTAVPGPLGLLAGAVP